MILFSQPQCKGLDLCVNCFAECVTIKQGDINHSCSHSYSVINKLNFPIYSHDWTAEEELLLFEGLERFGYGNWADIAEHMATDKTKEELEAHYDLFYLNK